MRLEDRGDHFNGGACRLRSAEWLAILIDRSDEITRGKKVSSHECLDIGERFGLANARRRDRHPGASLVRGPERAALEDLGGGFRIRPQVDDTFGADELHTKAGRLDAR